MLRASERWPGSQVNVARASGKPAAEYGDFVKREAQNYPLDNLL